MTWGANNNGQTTVPVSASSGVVAISAGGYHNIALKSDGSVVAWGDNSFGQISVPASVSSQVIGIAAGGYHNLALKGDGSVVAWGSNWYGETTVPADASSGIIAIAASGQHSLALKNDGSIVSWGNDHGSVPPEASSGIIAIASGYYHTVALKTDHTIVTWGSNSYGETTVPSAASSEVIAIAAGGFHTVALKSDGSVVAWGNNEYGQSIVPSAASSGIVSIAAGRLHTLALKSDGSVLAWGSNGSGQATMPFVIISPLGSVPTGTITMVSDVGEINCQWSGTNFSGICASEALNSGTPVVLTANLPVMPEGYLFAWDPGCDSITATTCTVNSLKASKTISPAVGRVPDAPTISSVTSNDASATINFTAPMSNGGLDITKYTVTSSPGNITATGTSSPITALGLTPGTSYTFTVTATNAVGTGPVSAASNPVVIARMTSSTSLSSSSNPSIIGSPVTLTSSVTGTNPSGAVTFMDGQNVLGTGMLSGSPAIATLVTSTLTTGTHSLTAVYAGDDNNEPSSSNVVSQNVQIAGSTMLLVDSDAGSWVGQGRYYKYSLLDGPFSVSVYPSNMIHIDFHTPTYSPRWTLSFSAPNGELISVGTYTGASGLSVSSSDFPTCTTSNNSFDVREITYGADGQVVSFWAIFEQHCYGEVPALRGEIRINANAPNSVTLIKSPADPSVIGTPLTFSALVSGMSGTPTGTVTFNDGPTVLGTASLSGNPAVATYTTSSLTVGRHSISAVYEGEGSFEASNSMILEHAVQLAGKSLLIAQSEPGEFIGQGDFHFSTLADGTFSAKKSTRRYSNGVYASFYPWSYYTLARNYSGVWSVDISAPNGAPLTVGTYPGAKGSPSPGEPGLNVELYRSCSTTTGSFEVKEVTYGPNDDMRSLWLIFEQYCNGSSPALRGEIRFNADAPNTAASIKSSLNPSIFGQAVTLTATVKSSISAPTGTVTFKNGSVVLGSSALVGDPAIASFTTSSLSVGTHPLTAIYEGDTNFASSTSGVLNQAIKSLLTVNKTGLGSGDITTNIGTVIWNGNVGIASYDLHSSVVLTATANAGSKFDGWSGDCSGTSVSSSLIMDASYKTCTASFGLEQYVVTTSTGTGGSISPTSALVSYGSTTSFTVQPDPGFHISSATGCGGTLSGLTYCTRPINNDCTVTASFMQNMPHWVSTSTDINGRIDPSSAFVSYGSTTTFSITPNHGYHVTAVKGCGGTFNGNDYITGPIFEDCIISAFFAPDSPPLSSNMTWTSNGPDGAGISTIAIDPLNPSTLYAGAWWGGIYKSTDSGANWMEINTGLSIDRVKAIAIDPVTPTTVYASIAGGLIKSTNGGGSWGTINNGLSNTYVYSLAINPHSTGVIYAGTMGGIYKSIDGGANWSQASVGAENSFVRALAIDPVTSSIIYAGTNGGGVFKSTNSGSSWAPVNTSLPSLYIEALTIDPAAPDTIYAATSSGTCKSTNAGSSWFLANTGMTTSGIHSLVIDPVTPGTVYAGTRNGIFKSVDSGSNWGRVDSVASYTNVYSLAIAAATPSVVYAGTDAGVIMSLDSGVSWTMQSQGLKEYHIRALIVDPIMPATIYAGTDGGGVFKSIDKGATWSMVNTGITTGFIDRLAIDPAAPETLYAGTGYGVFKTIDGAANWSASSNGMLGHDSQALVVDPVTPSVLYSGSSSGWVFKSLDGGQNWTAIKTDACDVRSLAIDPDTTSTVYLGTNGCGFSKSSDGGATWTTITIAPDASTVADLVIDLDAPGVMYAIAGTTYPPLSVYKSVDGGLNWTEVTVGLPYAYFYSLTIDPLAASTIYLGSANGVYKSIDGGASWAPANTGLTDYAYAIAIDPASPTTIYAGTSKGVYSTAFNPTIIIRKYGTGSGNVTSNPTAVDCGDICSNTFDRSAIVTLIPSPTTASVFDGWSGDSDCTDGVVTMNTDKICTASFNLKNFTVTVSSSVGGSLSPDEEQTVNYESILTFMVTPETGYHIDLISGCSGTLSGSAYVTGPITSNCAITATFAMDAPAMHLITLNAGQGGSFSSSLALVSEGTYTNFIVTANQGYHLATVTGCGGSLFGRTYSVGPITADCTISATFAINTPQAVDASAIGNGSISPSSALVMYGSTTMFTVTPDSGYRAAVGGTCGGLLVDNVFTTDVITEPCTVVASFSPVESSVVVQVPETGLNKCYDTAGIEINCAGTGQDGELQTGMTWPEPRFDDNQDGTVTDQMTGLVWLKDANCFGYITWLNALTAIKNFNDNPTLYGCSGYSANNNDWRMPNINELRSLVDYTEANPVLLSNHPFVNVQNSYYFSSTTQASGFPGYDETVYTVSMADGRMNMLGDKDEYPFYVWPVRGESTGPVKLAKTGQSTCKNELGSPIDCTGTGQDGELQKGVEWPEPRMQDNGDQTITDSLTGLMWLKNGSCNGSVTWQQALDFVKDVNQGLYPLCSDGYSDWRVPNINEIETLSHLATAVSKRSWLYSLGFYNISSYYWTSTSNASIPNEAHYYSLPDKSISIPKTYNFPGVLLVRSGQSNQPVAQNKLIITKSGTGNGTVTSDIAGINCGQDCSKVYLADTSVELTAAANPNSTFEGWSGECTGTGTCPVMMSSIRKITALFQTVLSGDMNADNNVDIMDALKALHIAAGLETTTSDDIVHGDVAPLVDGRPQPDGKIDIGDVVVILRKAVGLVSW